MPENNPITDAELAELDRWLTQANQPYAPRLKAAKRDAQAIVTRYMPGVLARLEAAEREREEARKENDFMRLRLAESDKACVYCDLPKTEMGACAHGFPGCARADDLLHCDELTRRDAKQRREVAAEELSEIANNRFGDGLFLPDRTNYTAAEVREILEQAAKRLREGGE